MATVREILDRKGSQVLSISQEATVLEAAQAMNQHKVGCLVVIDHGRVGGMISERDVLIRVVAECRDPAATKVRDVMTRAVVCCRMETDLEEARSVFKNRRIRHMPVVDQGEQLLGLVSIGDLNAYHADVQEQTIYLLQEYIYGRS
jgi:CBS domain-containing protein